MTEAANKGTDAIRLLRAEIGQHKVVTHGADYDRATHLWNAAVSRQPQMVVLCERALDAQAGIVAARRFALSVSVRGGGHDWAGRSLRGDLVLDLSAMAEVVIDRQEATVGGGTLATELAERASDQGLLAVTGIIGTVGVAGLTLGGGYGHFTARYGLAMDNLLGAEVVLADGRIVHTDATHEPELFWALRGGGGNFGVVTSLRLQLHPIPNVSDGIVVYPWEQAKDVFRAYNAQLSSMPDELMLMPTFFAAPDGKLSVVLHHAWCGEKRDDNRMIERAMTFGTSMTVQIGRKTFAEILRESQRRTMTGIHWIVRTVTLPEIGPEAVDIIKGAMENRSSPLSWIAAHPFHGAAERIPLESTAFGIRERHFMVGIYTAWQPGDEAPHKAWADSVEAALKRFALFSAYPNYFGADRPEQAALAYGSNTARLLRVKEQYDPEGVFNAISLPLNPLPGVALDGA